jgi:hypothetical protein
MVRPCERSRLFDRRRQVLFVGDVLASPDLDERFTTSEESDHSRPRIEHDAAKLSIGHIAASQPHNLRRWTLLSEQLREIIILRDDHDRVRCGASRREDFGVARTVQPEFLDVVSTRALRSLKHRAKAGGSWASIHTARAGSAIGPKATINHQR